MGDDDEIERVMRAAKRSAEVWVHLIYLTGGEVEWHKCVGDAFVWSFDDDDKLYQLKPKNSCMMKEDDAIRLMEHRERHNRAKLARYHFVLRCG